MLPAERSADLDALPHLVQASSISFVRHLSAASKGEVSHTPPAPVEDRAEIIVLGRSAIIYPVWHRLCGRLDESETGGKRAGHRTHRMATYPSDRVDSPMRSAASP